MRVLTNEEIKTIIAALEWEQEEAAGYNEYYEGKRTGLALAANIVKAVANGDHIAYYDRGDNGVQDTWGNPRNR